MAEADRAQDGASTSGASSPRPTVVLVIGKCTISTCCRGHRSTSKLGPAIAGIGTSRRILAAAQILMSSILA
jgi:hypothetical protein